jgi:DNA replication ATP-dependent helicase Dna2
MGVSHWLFNKRTFDYCIVDEASQVTLPTIIGPLRFAKTFVLVGDHHQLPPVVRSTAAFEGGLDISLFKYLCQAHPAAVVNLTHQYRMNRDVMRLSNLLVYDGQLVCGNDEVARRVMPIPSSSNLESWRPPSLEADQRWLDLVLEERYVSP